MSYANPYLAPQSPLNIPVANESYPPELRYVADGFALQTWVVRTMVIGFLCFLGIGLWASQNRGVDAISPNTMTVLSIVYMVILCVLQLLAFASFNKSPTETGARGTSNFAMIMFIAGVAMYVIFIGVIQFGLVKAPTPIMILGILMMVCLLTSSLALMIYFRQIANYLQDVFAIYITNSLVNATIVQYVCIGIVMVIALIAGDNMFGRGPARGNDVLMLVFGISMLGAVVLGFYSLIVYLNTIGGMRKLLDSKMRQY